VFRTDGRDSERMIYDSGSALKGIPVAKSLAKRRASFDYACRHPPRITPSTTSSPRLPVCPFHALTHAEQYIAVGSWVYAPANRCMGRCFLRNTAFKALIRLNNCI
jgi:hypothetical protein